ncbi:adhesive domain-containing protein [Candidatus Enterococcus murrayae]|uniref:WxL domain-containing protein n=1 Tax=Candidatus Enterococcus murrayae TaxID=2815321 RepID=A0ABS3HH24_9ENTE|nr:adhesive domain-containing protein [Enterococcus sp. MJM16]MBO0452761.1 WxL domain-containing protein [Enterococcus sp. MJM16]
MKRKRARLFQKIWIIGSALFLFLTSSNMIVSAVSVDLFATTQVNNNSGTTAASPYLNVSQKPVNFTINGTTTGVGLIKTGKKYVLISVPSQLSGKVTPNGSSTVTTSVTIPLADLPIGGLLTLLTTLVSTINTLLPLNPSLQAPLNSLNQAISNLKNENYGNQNLSVATEQLSATLLGVNISQGLLPILTSTLSNRLTDLNNVLNTLPLGLIGVILTQVLSSVNGLITALGNPNSTISTNLVSASILGSTNVSMPTFVTSPTGLTQNYAAAIRGGIVQTDDLTIQLLSNFGGNTTIYFGAGELAMKSELLPTNLNFGTHQVQTKIDETWKAYIGGNSANPLQTGTIRIDDTRTTAKAWQLKVAQANNWTSGQKSLSNARLDIALGALNTNFQNYFAVDNQTIQMSPSNQVTLMSLSNTTAAGYVELPLNQFQLFVPKNTPRQTGSYQTTLQWTISNTP